MRYHVRWTDELGNKRDSAFYLRKTAVIFLNRLIIDCHRYDAHLVYR
jgi:hypothetical protein